MHTWIRRLCRFTALSGAVALTVGTPATAQDGVRVAHSLDNRLAVVGAHASSFGGMFVDADSKTLFVYVTQPADAEQVVRAVRAEFTDEELSFADNVRTLPAKYSLQHLQGWYRHWGELFGIDGVVYTDLNGGKNRLEVGVSSTMAHTAVAEALDRLGIPREAVVLAFTDPIVPHSGLRSRHRPLVGGAEIRFSTSNGVYICTYGFAARRWNKAGYVTNSHCSESRDAGADLTKHFQPGIWPSNKIGQETVDPPLFTGGACPSGYRCRYSDAAWSKRYDSVSAIRLIARPPLNSIEWNGVDRFRVTKRGNVAQGVTVTKVGRTSGRTRGQVTNTCVNIGVSGTDLIMLCNNLGEYTSEPGDSGSPVFLVTHNPAQSDVMLLGINWGGNGTVGAYSPVSGIEQEIGPLKVCAQGFNC